MKTIAGRSIRRDRRGRGSPSVVRTRGSGSGEPLWSIGHPRSFSEGVAFSHSITTVQSMGWDSSRDHRGSAQLMPKPRFQVNEARIQALRDLTSGGCPLTLRMFPNKSRTDFLDNPDDVRSAFGIQGVSQHQEPLHDDPPPNNLDSFPTGDSRSRGVANLSDSGIRPSLGRISRLRSPGSCGS